MSRRQVGGLAVPVVMLVLAGASGAQEATAESELARMLAGKRLVGYFSIVTPQGESAPQADNYMVSELTRGDGNRWIFRARMGTGAGAAELPVPVEVLWAGDTPVLTMTEQDIEGLGTFTARVLLHGGRYAGTWQHGPVGGNMWGRLVDAEAETTGTVSPSRPPGAPGEIP